MSLKAVTVEPPHGVTPVDGTRDEPAESVGLSLLDATSVDVVDWTAWARGDGRERLFTAANFGAAHATLRLPAKPPRRAILLSSTDPDRLGGEVDLDRFILLPQEAVVLLALLDEAAAPAAEPSA